MGIIAFIKAVAFISSIVAKIIALPFVLMYTFLRKCWHEVRKIRRASKEHKIEKSKQKIARKEKAKREKEAAQEAKQRKRKKKEALRQAARQRKIKRQQGKRELVRQKRLKREADLRKKAKRKSSIENFAIFKDINSPFVKKLRLICWKLYMFSRRVYWVSRSVLQRIYWGLHSLFRRVYWVARGILQKMYWGLHSLFRRIYWVTRGLLQKAYWGMHTLFRKIYWRSYTIIQKIYWGTRVFLQKLYWKYYVKSRELYGRVTKNSYIDLFFVFFRGYLNKNTEKMSFVKISSVREYIKHNSQSSEYHVIEEGQMRTVCIPEFFEKSAEELQQFKSPEIYVAKLKWVSLIGGSNVVIANEVLLNDAAAYDKEHREDIRYSAIKKVIHGVAVIADSDKVELLEKGINLVGAASFNYYHLVVEILSRLSFVDSIEEYREYPILVDEVVMRIPQFKSALECINHYNHPIVVLEKEKKYQVEELVFPSSNVWMPTNLYNRDSIRVEDFLIADTVVNNIRENVGIWNEKEPWRKIFISRKNTQAVRLSNEKIVRRIFEKNGFEIVYTEEMTFRQQVECFGQAKCIVATSGAALTNTIFCQKGAVIGCIIPIEHRFYMYSTIAHLLGLKPLFLDAQITDKTPYAAADTFVLDEDYVERYVQLMKSI